MTPTDNGANGMHVNRQHQGIFAFEDQPPSDETNEDDLVVPENLDELTQEALDHLEFRATEAFDTLYDTNPTDPGGVATLAELAEAIESLRNERGRRDTVRAQAEAETAALHERVHEVAQDEEVETETEAPAEETETPAEPEAVAAAAIPAQPRRTRRLNIPLSEIRARAPEPEVPEQRLTITAAADVPRYAAGHSFADVGELADAFYERAKSTPVSASGLVQGPKVATIRREFKHTMSLDTPLEDVNRIIKEMTNQEALVAGGGWCSPSETTYSFFDITCEDGMVDLPTFGVSRGGIRYPVSPSLASVFTGTFTNATNPWLWTETDDILTVTGSTNKPCVRVPCPTFDDVRLECYGICLTAGNLTDNAFPEATAHQLGLLRSAHYHAMNQRYIAAMVTLASAAVTGGFFDDCNGLTSDLLAATEWAAVDYRTRYGMCETDVLEVVLPFWARAVVRADLSRRTGIDMLAVTDAQINDFFDVRSVRVQWVKDWQVRGTNQPGGASATVLYPSTVDFLIYAAGTYGLGNGMTLDLGLVRDSVLNAENDHTAAWMEECHLVALLGHEARHYTVCVCAAGLTGSASITGCGTA